MIDHIAVAVDHLDQREQDAFWSLLGFEREPVEQTVEERKWNQCWYSDGGECDVHVVEAPKMNWSWAHLCINSLSMTEYMRVKHSQWCVRARPGSPRIWLLGPGDIRVEVRVPSGE